MQGDYYPKIWAAMLKQKRCFSLEEISEVTGIPLRVTKAYLEELMANGALYWARPNKYALNWGERQATQYDACWNYARNFSTFTTFDLQQYAGASVAVARCFVSRLMTIGYVELVRRRSKADDYHTYRLVKNTGILPLKFHHNGELFDPNTNELFQTRNAKKNGG